ncbi:MAG: UDP-N-acetylmuramoyl-tripeptide--D-alanyl-D-alanine ligase [Candidatus Krumholzibacteriota bacterium]
MGRDWYSAARAAKDLADAGLLAGMVAPGPRGVEWHGPDGPADEPAGGFAGAGLDSRHLAAGQLFAALKGEHADGRDYMAPMVAAGHWVLAEHSPGDPAIDPAGLREMAPNAGVLLTADAAAALACLAGRWRSRFDLQVVGVTGTNGKTTTKDLLAAILRGAGPTCATAGNFNNRLGLPLTLLGLTAAHRFAVIEMGASAVGDIARLAPLAAPRTGIITNASPAHLAEFGSLADIIQGKGELLDVLPADGCAVLNADSPGYADWRGRARCPVVSFGRTQADHVWNWRPRGPDGQPRIEMDGRLWPVPLPGEHNGANLAAALLAARSFDLDDDTIGAGLENFSGSPHRGILLEIGGRLVLDDCYNANPVSMVTASAAAGRLPGRGRTIAILGAMGELGDDSAAIHERTGLDLADGPVDVLIAVGENARPLGTGFDAGGGVSHYCADLEEAARLAALHTKAGDRLLIKGSRSAAMEAILPLLAAAFRKN